MTTPRAGHTGLHAHALRFASRFVAALLRRGVRLGPMMLLTVRGRKTGLPRTTPVDVFEHDGRRWLVSTHGTGDAAWVRNLRAAERGVLRRGRTTIEFTAAEVPSHHQAAVVLREVLGPRLARPAGGVVLRRVLHLARRPPPSAFEEIAPLHPVFALTPRGATHVS